MFCSKCGKELPDGSNFCFYCGAGSSRAETAAGPAENAAAMPAAEYGVPYAGTEGTVRNKPGTVAVKKSVIYIAVCAFGLLLGICIFLIIKNGSGDSGTAHVAKPAAESSASSGKKQDSKNGDNGSASEAFAGDIEYPTGPFTVKYEDQIFNVESFEITSIEEGTDNYRVCYDIKGEGDNAILFLDCYDPDGYLTDTIRIWPAGNGGKWKERKAVYIDKSTVRIVLREDTDE